MSRLRRRFAIDNNFLPTVRSPERAELMSLHLAEIELGMVDVTRTEWKGAPPDVASALEAEAQEMHEYFGPAVLGHSRLGSAVLGSELDQERLDEVAGILFPGHTLRTIHNRQNVRDAMHIATAIRYAFDAFITNDAKLSARNRVFQDRFNFSILSPSEALAFVRRLQKRAEFRERGKDRHG